MNNLQRFLSNYVEFAVFTIYGNYVTIYLREMFPVRKSVFYGSYGNLTGEEEKQ